MKESIFVMIPSYRDVECQYTLTDLFAKASGKYTINVGVYWQLGAEDSYMVPHNLHKYSIKNLFCDYQESKGCCWVRSELLTKLYIDETYIFSIDSHSRFEQDWDDILVSLIKKYTKKHIISTYPNGYEPPNTLLHSYPHKIQAHGKNKDDLPLLSPIKCEERTTENHYIAAGFLFCYARAFQDVQYDPFLYFFGEEITLAVRFWTHGYTILNPGKVVLYHYYVRKESPHHWTDNKSPEQIAFRNGTIRRVKHLLGLEICHDKNILIDIDKYGLGRHRSLEEYFSTTKIKELPLAK